MPRTSRFHLDEQVAHAIADGLRRLGVDVTTSTETGLLGSSDTDQLAYAVATGRVVFTEDRDYLVLAAAGAAHAGLAYCARNSRSIGQIIRGLELLWEVYESHEMLGQVEFL
jgi:predicted nuclease of predicted toxin-antitoxin system